MIPTPDFRRLCRALGYETFAVLGLVSAKKSQRASSAFSDLVLDLCRSAKTREPPTANQNYGHLRLEKRNAEDMANAEDASLATTLPWSCIHGDKASSIEAFDAARNDWACLLTVEGNAQHSAVAITDFIARSVNTQEKNEKTIAQLIRALEDCLQCKGRLNWAAEYNAKVVIRRAKQKP